MKIYGSGIGVTSSTIPVYVWRDWGKQENTQNSLSPGWVLSPRSPGYETGVITTLPRLSLILKY
jgi:hypothetical protein